MAFAVPLSLDSTQALRGPNSHLFHVDASRDRMYHRRNPRRSYPGALESRLRRWWQ